MAEDENGLALKWDRVGKNAVAMTATVDGEIVAADQFSIGKEKDRRSFADGLIEKCPALDREAVEKELLGIAAKLAERPAPAGEPEDADVEIEVSQVVRPELFHRPEVSGMLIPSTVRRITPDGPKTVGRWDMIFRWKSGRRERVPLRNSLKTKTGTIYFDPIPSDPLPTRKAGWSKSSQEAWLQGAGCPDVAELFLPPVRAIREVPSLPRGGRGRQYGGVGLLVDPVLWVAGMGRLSLPSPDRSERIRKGRGYWTSRNKWCFRPLSTSSASAPTLFRRLHSEGGVILLDEAESLRRTNDPGAADLANVFNSGYRRGGSADRLEKVGDTFQPVSFSTFGLKALASINPIPDALESRCIPIRMFRCPTGSEKPRRRIRPDDPVWQGLRDRLHILALETGPKWIALADDTTIVPDWIGGRNYEKWQPILSIARWIEDAGIEGLHSLLVDHAKVILDGEASVAVPDVDGILLKVVARRVRNLDYPTAKEVLEDAREEEPEGFTRWTAHAVARHLRQYGLQTMKSNGRLIFRPTTEALSEIERAYGVELT